MNAASGERPLHVVILGDWLPFPHGLATTGRALLVARALSEAGAHVRVLCLQAADHPSHVENTEVRGEHAGIPFEYASGTTVRRGRFLARRLIAAWGWLNGARRLVQLRKQDCLDAVLLWFWTPRPCFRLLCFTTLLRLLRVPMVREVNETPWSQKPDASALERLWSPLAGANGAVTISADLHEWASQEVGMRRGFRIVDVPILVDVFEREPAEYPSGDPLVVFAGAPDYRTTIRFLFAAMREVLRNHPTCRLAVTGAARGDPAADWLWDEAKRTALGDHVDLLGFLSRAELLDLYARAHALLIPLFNDQQSRSRFPTKIGEYLAAARPVVTSSVGEIPAFLTDGLDAVVCPPGDPVVFGRAIDRLLADPATAATIGRNGRRIAEQRFHYARYADTLAGFLTDLAAEVRTPPRVKPRR